VCPARGKISGTFLALLEGSPGKGCSFGLSLYLFEMGRGLRRQHASMLWKRAGVSHFAVIGLSGVFGLLATLRRMQLLAHPRATLGLAVVGLMACLIAAPGWGGSTNAAPESPRWVSLNPSLTAILVALEADDALVGVDAYSARQQGAVAGLPRVGGLFNPSLEAVVALKPDRVVLVPSVEQKDFRRRLEALGIPVSSFENQRFAEVLENIARLGALVDRQAQATERILAIRRVEATIREKTRDLDPPRTLVVLQRDPLFIVGRDNFVAEMLATAGGKNVGDVFDDPYPRVGLEWVVENAPEVLIDMDPDAANAREFWSRWPTLPAVVGDRVFSLDAQQVTLPGPWLDRSLLSLVTALHGPVLAAQVSRDSEISASMESR
jgi:iron complex transport system substrate-binding protein